MHNRVGKTVESREISVLDGAVLVPVLAVIVFLALYPQFALKRSEGSVKATVAAAQGVLTPGLTAAADLRCPPRAIARAEGIACLTFPRRGAKP